MSLSPAAPGELPPARWRKLEGSDPAAYEMVLKIQALQKRLIAKTEEVVEKDLAIQVRAGRGGGAGGLQCGKGHPAPCLLVSLRCEVAAQHGVAAGTLVVLLRHDLVSNNP